MGGRRLAAFFIPKQQAFPSIEAALATAGATSVEKSPDSTELWLCRWVGMSCDGCLYNQLEYYQLLVIFFLQSVFLELLPPRDSNISIEMGADYALAVTFKQACESLRTEVAFIASNLYEAKFDEIVKKEKLVRELDATALANEHFGLLYLNDAISLLWIPHPVRDDRDSLPIDNGRLVFSGRGGNRWY